MAVCASVALALLAPVLIIAQAELLARALAGAFEGRAPGAPLLAVALLVVIARGFLLLVGEWLAQRTAVGIKNNIRREVLADAWQAGPRWRSDRRRGEIVVLLTRGLDALDPYLTGYLPALLPAVTVPLGVLIWLATADPLAALIVGCTVPLIPVFGALVGRFTRTATLAQWATMERLGGHFADMVEGLPTLKMFGRAAAHARRVGQVAHEYRHNAMRTLRVAFLSALVLELVATIAVALVAVPVGLRLLDGQLTLQTALVVLLLAPEAFLPLRALGTRFHASVEGVTVAEQIFSALDQTRAGAAPGASVSGGESRVWMDRVSVTYPDRPAPALRDVSLSLDRGERLALTGASGAGKSTLLGVLLGFAPVTEGQLLLDGTDAATMTPDGWARWRAGIGWIAQEPYLFADTLAANIALQDPDGPAGQVLTAARAARVDDFANVFPRGLSTRIGEGGSGLSAGQRQRVALARAYYRKPGLLLLDEPTAHLDSRSESLILESTRELMRERTAIFVTHRRAMLAAATRIIELREGGVSDARLLRRPVGVGS